MKHFVLLLSVISLLVACGRQREAQVVGDSATLGERMEEKHDTLSAREEIILPEVSLLKASDVILTKELLYDKYTLDDVYPYKDTVRSFKWEVMRKCLAYIENMQQDSVRWVVLQNYRNLNSEAPLVRRYVRNAYRRVADTLGVERYQSVPLYLLTDTLTPERYGRDGTIAYLQGREGSFCRILPATFEEEWLVPERYLKPLADTTVFHHVIFVDRRDQNIATLERTGRGEWKIRSMNPATTGRHAPPYAQETPLGMYLVQQKKTRMVFLKDGSAETGDMLPMPAVSPMVPTSMECRLMCRIQP